MTQRLLSMKFVKRIQQVFFISTILAAVGVSTAQADDIAIILGGSHVSSKTLAALADVYQNSGYQVLVAHDPDASASAEIMRISAKSSQFSSGQRIVILLGDVVHTRTDSFFLSQPDQAEDLARLYRTAIPLSAFVEFTEPSPAESVIVIGGRQGNLTLGPAIQPGLGALDLPQGVALVTGEMRPTLEFQ